MGAGGAGVAGDVDADGQLCERRESESDGVADPLGSDGDGDGGLAVECQGMVGGWDDGGVFVSERDVSRADDEWGCSEGVREVYAQGAAADAGAHDHADGLVVEATGWACGWWGGWQRSGVCGSVWRRGWGWWAHDGWARYLLRGGPCCYPVCSGSCLR